MSTQHRNSVLLSSALAVLATALLVGSDVAAQQLPAEAFAALPAMESPSISPDGKRLAFITHSADGTYVFVVELDGMQVTTVVQINEGKTRDVFWANDEALVFTAGLTESAAFITGLVETVAPYGIDLSKGGEVTRLLRDYGRVTRRGGGGATLPGMVMFASSGAQLIGFQRSTGRVLYPRVEVPELERSLYSVDPKTDRRTLLDKGTRFTADWVVNEAGEPIVRIDYSQRRDRFTVLVKSDDGWNVALSEITTIPEMSVYGLNDAGELIVRVRPDGGEHFGLYALSTETGRISRRILVNDEYDVGGARIDPYTNRVVGSGFGDSGTVWFDAELAEHQRLLDEAFPGESPVITSWSEDRSRFIVLTESGDRSPAVYLYDAKAPSVDQIGSVYTALGGRELPSRSGYVYVARDGTRIPGYLTRPNDADGPTPGILLPHGGPAARDYGGFDWLAHFLASRGYTVLQPNFRGSAGYGQDWEDAGHGGWGIGVMQDDLTDGVANLIEAGLVDPERVCIVGASYGGYAALAGAVFTPELYRCAAAVAPVSDLYDMFDWSERRSGSQSSTVSYWLEAMGGGEEVGLRDRLRAASPAAHVDQVTAPILLIHGRDDSVVPLSQSETMLRTLRSAGKEAELVYLDGEDHWLSVAATRLATLRALEAFLADNLDR